MIACSQSLSIRLCRQDSIRRLYPYLKSILTSDFILIFRLLAVAASAFPKALYCGCGSRRRSERLLRVAFLKFCFFSSLLEGFYSMWSLSVGIWIKFRNKWADFLIVVKGGLRFGESILGEPSSTLGLRGHWGLLKGPDLVVHETHSMSLLLSFYRREIFQT
jgi:hypothetical protein